MHFSYDHVSFSGLVKWDRLKLQDLHILMTVGRSMREAAQNPQHDPTCRFQINLGTGTYASGASVRSASPRHRANHLWSGAARLRTSLFDNLRQGHIEFLSDRALDETRIGGNEAIIAGLLSSVLERLRQIDNRTGERILESSITGYSFRRTARRSRDKGWAASGGALKVERCLL
jgi:hypothetical protein